MKGARQAAMLMVAAAMPLAAAACGDDSAAGSTLPPMITTTTTTTVLVTTTTTVTFYTVKSNDTLSKIADLFKVDQAELMTLNGITDPDHVELGAVLKIPPPTTGAPVTT